MTRLGNSLIMVNYEKFRGDPSGLDPDRTKMPVKPGPASVLQRQIEQVGLMPRTKQKFITEMLDALIKQQSAQG